MNNKEYMRTISISRTFVLCATVLLGIFFAFTSRTFASTSVGTIDTVHAYAWSNNDGWINFSTLNGNVVVTDTKLTGYIWDQNTGWINLSPSQAGVTNDGEGHLGGFAWGYGTGWINFTGVTIDTAGRFHGIATGSTTGASIGSLTFDCTNCWVQTDWRTVTFRNSPVTGGGGTPSSGGGSSGGSAGGSSGSTPTSTTPGIPPSNPTVATIGQSFTTNPPSQFNPTSVPSPTQPKTLPPRTRTIVKAKPATTGQAAAAAAASGSQTFATKVGQDCIQVTNDILTLKPTECGILNENLPGIGMVTLEVLPGSSAVPTIFQITVQTAHQTPGQPPVGDVYNIAAFNAKTKAPIHTFAKLLKITLPVPASYRGKNGLHLTTKETQTDPWTGVNNPVFGYDTVTFYADHLSMFTITSDEGMSTQTANVAQPTKQPASPTPSAQSSCVLIPAIDAYLGFYVNLFGCTLIPLMALAVFIVLVILILIIMSIMKRGRAPINNNIPPGMSTGQSM